MTINEIKLLFSNELTKYELKLDIKRALDYETVELIQSVGTPNEVMNKFTSVEPYFFSENQIAICKSNLDYIYFVIELDTEEVYCVSDTFKTRSFLNSNFTCFLQTNFIFELYRKLVQGAHILGDFNENYEQYAECLNSLISECDKKAASTGIWGGLIQEKSMGMY